MRAFLGHFQCEDHPGHAVPDLPRPLARLWFHPCLISAEKQFQISGSIMTWGFFLHNFTERYSLLGQVGSLSWPFPVWDHPGHAVPDLPRPLANLWIHPCLISAEKTVPILREQNQKVFFYILLSLKDRCFLLKLGAFLGHFQCEEHPGHAVPNLPRPLANLGRHPGQRIEEKPAV